MPKELLPSKNATVPVAATGETVAVNVTLAPELDGFADEVSVVVVDASERPHDGNLKPIMRVFQFADCVLA